VIDIEEISRISHEHNAIVTVDNTFMTAYNQNPIELGADVICNSASKYLNCFSDLTMGFLLTNSKEIYEKLEYATSSIGAVPGPFESSMVLKSL